MAFVKVTVPEPEDMDEDATFQKFEALGDKLAGIFLSKHEATGNYGKKWNYKFRTQQGLVICTPPYHLKQLFEAANGDKGLQKGDKVIAKYVSDKPMRGNDKEGNPKNPMKMFDLLIDDGKGAPTKPSAKPPPKPAPAPAPAPQGEADDFSDFDVPY